MPGWIEPPGQPPHRDRAPDPLGPGVKQQPPATATADPSTSRFFERAGPALGVDPQSPPARPAAPQTPTPQPASATSTAPGANAPAPSDHGQRATPPPGPRRQWLLRSSPAPANPGRLPQLTTARLAILNHRLAQTRVIGRYGSPLPRFLTIAQWGQLMRLKEHDALVRDGQPINQVETRWSDQDFDREIETLTFLYRAISRAADQLSCSHCGLHGLFHAKMPADARANTLIQCQECGAIVCLGCAPDGRFLCPDCRRRDLFGLRRFRNRLWTA